MLKKISLLSIILLINTHCKKDSPSINTKETEDNIVENVTNNDKILSSFSSREYNSDLVEEIYQEILNNNKELTKLDNKIKDLNESTNSVIKEYNTVLSKSKTYYTAALTKTAQFNDSILAQKIDSLISKSTNTYKDKTKGVQTVIDSAEANKKEINDLYTAFKIKKTLSEIETYQNTNTFDLKNINNAVTKQNKLIEEIKKETSK